MGTIEDIWIWKEVHFIKKGRTNWIKLDVTNIVWDE